MYDGVLMAKLIRFEKDKTCEGLRSFETPRFEFCRDAGEEFEPFPPFRFGPCEFCETCVELVFAVEVEPFVLGELEVTEGDDRIGEADDNLRR